MNKPWIKLHNRLTLMVRGFWMLLELGGLIQLAPFLTVNNPVCTSRDCCSFTVAHSLCRICATAQLCVAQSSNSIELGNLSAPAIYGEIDIWKKCKLNQPPSPITAYLITVPLKGKYHKKMFPKFRQWIPSPKYI